MTIRVAYDTEFVERGANEPIWLVSIGMVRSDGAEYYAVNGDLDTAQLSILKNDPWLGPNVYAHLPQKDGRFDYGHPDVKLRDEIAWEVAAFCKPTPLFPGDEEPVELWAYFADYDHVVLSQLFGRMIDLPAHMPKFTMDLKQLMVEQRLKKEDLPPQPEEAHHALADARWVRDAFKFIINRETCDCPYDCGYCHEGCVCEERDD